jgi:hypothetical protein
VETLNLPKFGFGHASDEAVKVDMGVRLVENAGRDLVHRGFDARVWSSKFWRS